MNPVTNNVTEVVVVAITPTPSTDFKIVHNAQHFVNFFFEL